MLVARVYVSFLQKSKANINSSTYERETLNTRQTTYRSNTDDSIEVVDIDMHENAKQSSQNLLAKRREGFGKWHVGRHGEERFIVDLILDPVHQQFNVPGSRKLRWLLEYLPIGPQILVFGPTAHRWAGRFVTVFGYGAVYEIDSIEKIHYVHG